MLFSIASIASEDAPTAYIESIFRNSYNKMEDVNFIITNFPRLVYYNHILNAAADSVDIHVLAQLVCRISATTCVGGFSITALL